MNIRRLFINLILLFVAIIESSCLFKQEIFVITSNSTLSLPFEIAEVFGKFENSDCSIRIDVVNKENFIKFLNLSKYSVAITDNNTASKVIRLLPNWHEVCKIAEGSKYTYYLLAKRSFILNKGDFFHLIKSWNFGVDELKDPAVLKMMGIENLDVKFFYCKG